MYSPETLQSLWFGARVRPGTLPLTVTSLQADSPAAKAGLRVGDRIAEINGRTPRRFIEFIRELVDTGTSRTVSLVVLRGAERRKVSVRLVRESSFFNSELVRKKIGLSIEELTPQMAKTLGLGDKRGVIINEVDPDSPAARAGLQKNMIITTVDGQVTWYEKQPAPSIVLVAKMLHARKSGEKSQLEVIIPLRRGRYIEFQKANVVVTVK